MQRYAALLGLLWGLSLPLLAAEPAASADSADPALHTETVDLRQFPPVKWRWMPLPVTALTG